MKTKAAILVATLMLGSSIAVWSAPGPNDPVCGESVTPIPIATSPTCSWGYPHEHCSPSSQSYSDGGCAVDGHGTTLCQPGTTSLTLDNYSATYACAEGCYASSTYRQTVSSGVDTKKPCGG